MRTFCEPAIRVRRFIFRLSLITMGDFPSRGRDVITNSRNTSRLEHHRNYEYLSRRVPSTDGVPSSVTRL